MSTRGFVALIMAVAAVCLAAPVSAQSTAPEGWTAPRTADGQPDLQGIWSNNRATPMQRPEQFGEKATLTDEELAELTQQIDAFRDSEQAGDLLGDRLIQQALGNATFQDFDAETGNYNAFWLVERHLDNRTSLIVDPPNGRRPPQTAEAQARSAARMRGSTPRTVPRTGVTATAVCTSTSRGWARVTTAIRRFCKRPLMWHFSRRWGTRRG